MDRERDQKFQEITDKALDNPKDGHLRSLMRDYTETYPGYGDKKADEESPEPGEMKLPPGPPADGAPALASV